MDQKTLRQTKQQTRPSLPSMKLRALGVISALLLATVLGSISQSHVNLLAIAELTGGIALSDWLTTYWFDLRHFSPTLALILLPTFLLSFLLAALLRKFYNRIDYVLYFFTTVLIFYLALIAINFIAPMPTLIAANRTLLGTLALLTSSGVGALLFVYLLKRN